MSSFMKIGTNFDRLSSAFMTPPSLPPWGDVVYGWSLTNIQILRNQKGWAGGVLGQMIMLRHKDCLGH